MRFEDVTSDIYDILNDVVEKNFGATLEMAKFIILFDTKKRKTGGRYVVGRIKKANDELKALATDNDGISPDYILFLDKLVFMALDDRDKERVLFHELSHTDVNFDSDNQYRIRDHEIQSFYSEIDYNSDDQRWAERVSTIAEALYDPENHEEV